MTVSYPLEDSEHILLHIFNSFIETTLKKKNSHYSTSILTTITTLKHYLLLKTYIAGCDNDKNTNTTLFNKLQKTKRLNWGTG